MRVTSRASVSHKFSRNQSRRAPTLIQNNRSAPETMKIKEDEEQAV